MEARITEHAFQEMMPAVVQRARGRVLDLFNQRPDARLVFHNYPFAAALADRARDIARGEGLTAAEAETAQLAALFLPVGYAIEYQLPLPASLNEADLFLLQEGFPEERRRQVLHSLRTVGERQALNTPVSRALNDAYQISAFIDSFAQRSPLMRLEAEFFRNHRLDRLAWAKLQLQYLLQVQLVTNYGRTRFEDQLARLISEQKEEVESLAARQEADENHAELFGELERKRYPFRAIQTFFRTNYRNHINLSSIADNKANIMISVNSILISVLISILTYRNISENQPVVFLPAVIFLVTGLASLIFAVLSARPKVTNLNREVSDKAQIRKNLIFFGNFVHLDLDEYQEAMDDLFRDGELLYGNMTRDLYHLGKVLDKKYRYLSISYNIFMVGFIATVGSFLFLLLR